jgi:hypothetical protein
MTARSIRWLKVLLFLLCLVPLGQLLLETFGLAGFSLGANPVEELIHSFGKWGPPDRKRVAAPVPQDAGFIRLFLYFDAFSDLCRPGPEV